MPLYAAEPHRYPGSVFFPHYPCLVYDGAGELVEACSCADTDTGFVVRFATGPQGEYLIDPNDPGRALEVRESRPLPLVLYGLAPPDCLPDDDADTPHIIGGN